MKYSAVVTVATSLPKLFLSAVREIDGSDSGTGGKTHTQLVRACPDNYPGDGSGKDMNAPWLPNERTVSNTCMQQSAPLPNRRGMSDMIWAWGQFLDHDISLTEPVEPSEPKPLLIPDENDPLYPGPMAFERSEYDPTTGTAGNPRQQMNAITSYIDASNVYGSDKTRADYLRTFEGGKLKTSAGNLLPFNTAGLPNAGGPRPDMFIAGDVRANEQAGLASMHTLFVREHNRLASLIAKHFHWEREEDIYQMARKIVGAEMQVITYKEFLPALLGHHAPKLSDYNDWKSNVNAGIMNEFSTAIYRVGHTMLSPTLQLADANSIVDSIPLKNAFFNVTFLTDQPDRVDGLINGFLFQQAQEIDIKLIEDIRSLLFKNGPTNIGLDLASLNLRRGRDHGLAPYNEVRQKFGLAPATTFADITSNTEWATNLASVYDSVDDVELWIGALAEDHMEGASCGPLIGKLTAVQFENLRDGDKYFFMRDPDLRHPKLKSVIDLSKLTLAKVIEWNTAFKNLPENAFFTKDWVSLIRRSATLPGVGSPLTSARYYDGTDSGEGGAAHTQLVRSCPESYPGDGSGESMDYSHLPNERTVSNTCMKQSGLVPNSRGMSDMIWAWGQFLDHDISLTEAGMDGEAAPIPILDVNDPLYPGPMAFDRSEFDHTTSYPGKPRQQVNQITSHIDASNVYGSDKARADYLRTFVGGKLKMSAGNLLPFNTGGLPNAGGPRPDMFVAGDVRANEQAGLASMHTLFVREHNRLATLITEKCPFATDESIYQMVRKIVGAEMQIITYKEFLPALLGKWAPKLGDYKGWDRSVDAGIMNEFSTAIYRFGHTMLSPNLQMADGNGVVGSIPLRNAFFNVPFLTEDPGRVDRLINGFRYQRAQEIDIKLVEDIRSLLFNNGPMTVGLDLASLNLRRGRDHGLAPYNVARDEYGLKKAKTFWDITSNNEWATNLASVYTSVDDVDLWIGALAEDHLEGASVGELIKTILVDQFTKLRDGDRYFYLNDHDLSDPKVKSIIDLSDLTLGKVIGWNTVYKNQPDNVFFAPV